MMYAIIPALLGWMVGQFILATMPETVGAAVGLGVICFVGGAVTALLVQKKVL